MAELALISGVISVVGAGTKLSLFIFDFAASLGSAGKELQHVAAEISDLCSVLKHLQTVLEQRHFSPSIQLTTSATRIIEQCQGVFTEMEEIVVSLSRSRNGELFPSVDFVGKVKWVFSEKAKVQVLRSTLEACKTTLSVMLMTMVLAKSISHQAGSSVADVVEQNQDKAMTQNLIIAQQYALEQLELDEERAEKEEQMSVLLPVSNSAKSRHAEHRRHKSRGRLVKMFNGLSVVTDLPTAHGSEVSLPSRSERASVWLNAVIAPEGTDSDPHPGRQRHRRLSSIATANAPMQLLRKWTYQDKSAAEAELLTEPLEVNDESDMWRDSSFAFLSDSKSEAGAAQYSPAASKRPPRASTTLISPKTARVHSIGFHTIAGVDGGLAIPDALLTGSSADDDCKAIITSILGDHESAADAMAFELCVLYGGKRKRIGLSEQPLQILRHYEDLELEPILVLRRSTKR